MLSALSITEAHTKLQAKEISAVELVQDCLNRVDHTDDQIHAVVYDNREKALEKAKEIDSAGSFDHVLTGIPYMAKDVFCEKGVPTTACSNMLREKNYVPTHNSTTTNRLNAIGAISLGKVNTDEFTMGASTETSCYGVTRNPWNTECVAGGSSGGSAASIAADQCIFSLGTDTGGSIRQPASFCGVAGLRSTYGRTSRYGVMSMASSLDTIGPFGKNIEDIAHVLGIIAGKDTLDSTTGDIEVPDYAAALTGDIKGMKIGVPKEYFTLQSNSGQVDGIDADVEAAIKAAGEQLESLDAELVEISLPHTKYAVATYYVLTPCEVSSNMSRYDGIRYGHTAENPEDLIDYYFQTRSSGFGDEVKRRIMIGTYALSAGYFDAYYRQALKVRRLIQNDFIEAFKTVDTILSPVSPTPAFKVGAHSDDPVGMYLEDIFLSSQALAGIPALSMPCGFSSSGLPIGMQLMGNHWDEQTVLKVGHAYEQATEWHIRKPNL